MESGEHVIIGDSSSLPGMPDQCPTATLRVQNQDLTYGHIVALAGDYYGVASVPICLGATDADRRRRFMDALATLVAPSMPTLGPPPDVILHSVVGLINREVEALQPAADKPTPTGGSQIYADGKGVQNGEASAATQLMYPALARMNFDHFGRHAVATYLAGHRYAIELAVLAAKYKLPSGPTLEDAYIANAFADHFLTDLFSAGHLRTPRVELHDASAIIATGDFAAKQMHDEDSWYGINVVNNVDKGNAWLLYGDRRIFDSDNRIGAGLARQAVEASKQEVFDAFRAGVNPFDAKGFQSKALALAPDPSRIPANPQHQPLYNHMSGQLTVRKNYNDLRCSQFTTLPASFSAVSNDYKLPLAPPPSR